MTVAEMMSARTSDAHGKTVSQNVTFRNILVATDFSEPSRRALEKALSFAALGDAHLSVVHALQPEPQQYATLERPPELDLERMDAARQMNEFLGDLDIQHKIEAVYLRQGPVMSVVEALVKQNGIDLLVIGTRGRGGLRKLALGSVAEELLRVAPCPVLTIGPNAEVETVATPAELHNILFATDFGKASEKALPLALGLAKAHHAKLILLHVMSPIPASNGNLSAFAPPVPAADELAEWESAMRKQSLKRLKECVPDDSGLEPEYVVRIDFLPEALLESVERYDVDLVVMGANHAAMPRAMAHIPWAVLHEVVSHAPCPVLTVAG